MYCRHVKPGLVWERAKQPTQRLHNDSINECILIFNLYFSQRLLTHPSLSFVDSILKHKKACIDQSAGLRHNTAYFVPTEPPDHRDMPNGTQAEH